MKLKIKEGFMKKKTKIIILSAMIVLLGVTGYLNVVLNNSLSATTTTTTTSTIFSTYRDNRNTSRDQELIYLDAIIDSTSSSEEVVATAQTKKLNLISQIETELVAEGLIKASGFDDCVVSVAESGNVNVAVKTDSDELSVEDCATITSIIKEQFNVSAKNVVIIPVV